jgi:cytochrome c-type biogenesis protein CcmH
MFWALLIVVGLIAGAWAAGPMLGRGSSMKATGLLVVIAIAALTAVLYRGVGTPAALDASATAARGANPAMADQGLGELTENLRQRLEQDPGQIDGWVLLGRSYKSMQRFPEAVEALEKAAALEPDNPLVMVELVEAQLFASGSPHLDDSMVASLQRAIELDPGQQKALWLLGLDSAQRGDDLAAIGFWERLLEHLDPAATVTASVQEQLTAARQRAGFPDVAPMPEESAPAAVEGLRLRIDHDGQAPAGSVLFIIARTPGAAAGPPLAVRRLPQPSFPLETVLDDSHSMMGGGAALSAQAEVQVSARLSLTGRPQAGPGDWQSEPVVVAPNGAEPLTINLDQEVR